MARKKSAHKSSPRAKAHQWWKDDMMLIILGGGALLMLIYMAVLK